MNSKNAKLMPQPLRLIQNQNKTAMKEKQMSKNNPNANATPLILPREAFANCKTQADTRDIIEWAGGMTVLQHYRACALRGIMSNPIMKTLPVKALAHMANEAAVSMAELDVRLED